MNASVAFKFEKKKLASLIRSAPRIIDSVNTKKPNTLPTQTTAEKRPRLDSLEDVTATPKLYTDFLQAVSGDD